MKKIYVLILGMLSISNAFAQINITTGATVSQNFNGIGTTATASLPTNWKVSKNSNVRTLDTYAAAASATEREEGNNMSSSAANGIYNLGPDASTDRAIGFISSGSATKSGTVYVFLRNNGSVEIESFDIEYNIEKYRGGTNAAGFMMQMYTSSNGSTWASAGASFNTAFTSDAASSGFPSAPGATSGVDANLALKLAPGASLYLAWNYSVATGSTTSNAQCLALDDVSITANAALPISLLSFYAKKVSEKVEISWTTASEIKNEKFVVERSVNGEQFEEVGTVKGAGDSKDINQYKLMDHAPLKGTSYYRLTQFDFDGAHETFAPVAVKTAGKSMEVIKAKSNGDVLHLNIYVDETSSTEINIVDMNGRLVGTQTIQLQTGYQDVQILTTSFKSGLHLIQLKNNEEMVMKKMIL